MLVIVALALVSAVLMPSPVLADDAAGLRARYQTLRAELADNPFKRPLHLQSTETAGVIKGDIYARIDQSFSVSAPALRESQSWCEVLILHLNVKACQASTRKSLEGLTLNIGRKHDQPLDDTHKVDFRFRRLAESADFLHLSMDADQGPLGTSDYRIELAMVALDATHSFLHLSYSYAYGLSARAALKTYLATLGRDKIGFTRVNTRPGGDPDYVGGVRGLVERNTMRYYLAIEAYLHALALPVAQRQEQRFRDWHTGIERYPAQLHELERSEYLLMKRKEWLRQQTLTR